MLTNFVWVTNKHLHQILSKSAQFSVLVNVALAMVSDTEKKISARIPIWRMLSQPEFLR
jgi:hypothetical protein